MAIMTVFMAGMATPPTTHAGGTSDLDLSPQASAPIKRGLVVSRRLPDDESGQVGLEADELFLQGHRLKRGSKR